jgi:hypothetical protein
MMLIPNFNLFMSISKKVTIPIGMPPALPTTNRFKIPKSISLLILVIIAIDMIKDKIKLI